jgi:succinylglutamate desuccinylase
VSTYVAPKLPPIEIMPRDISGWRKGNTGIDYVHRLDSGKPGPNIHVAALTHGNEFCGMTALTWLFDRNVRPTRGTLTLSFGNVAAYESFDPARPLDSRFVDRDFNRVWSDAIIDSDEKTVEVRRARELRPAIVAADALLDIHSTTFPVAPMLVFKLIERSKKLAAAIREPLVHITTTGGHHQGGTMFEYGPLGDPKAPNEGLLVECGQHFARRSGEIAIQTMLRFLRHYDVIDRDFAAAHLEKPLPGNPVVYDVTRVVMVKTDDARFVKPVQGFEEFSQGELIAVDGAEEIRAPYDRCAIVMPKAQLVKGREMFTLARRL